METIIVKSNEQGQLNKADLVQAGSIIRNGGLVAFPTETVYGIGANAIDEAAIVKIYEAKGRPSDNPLIMHISDINCLKDYALNISVKAQKLINVFWPGPLTMVFSKTDKVPSRITGGLKTVAIRMPRHQIARSIIHEARVPIAAPSANISGKPSPTRGYHVIADLFGKVDMIIDGGKTELGLESTVLDVTREVPCILRPGSITHTMLEEVVGKVSYDSHIKDERHPPKSPGMKYKHYAPKGQLKIISSDIEANVIKYINIEGKKLMDMGYKVGAVVPKHAANDINIKYVESIGSINNHTEIGSNLFKILRKMDDMNIDYIFSFEFKGEDVSIAIMNRLNKAAGYNIVNV